MDPDIIIIGGGMAGISLGARLSEGARVTVLEAEAQPGYHSTGRSAAIFILNYGNALLRQLNAASLDFLQNPDEIGEPSLLTRRGELILCAPGEEDRFAAYLDGSFGLKQIGAAEAVAMVPILRADRIVAASYEASALDIDVDRMLQGFLRLMRRRGGTLATGAAVTELRHDAGIWTVVTSAGEWRAPVIVNAAGGWADRVAVMAGARPLGLMPMRRSAALIPAPNGYDVSGWPLFTSAAERWYAKPEAGKLMVSPADEDPVEPHDVWPEELTLAEGLARYEDAVTVPVTRVERRWAGMRTFAPDRKPVLGFDPEVPGFFWLAGQGGYGIQTAAAMSMIAASRLLGRSDPLQSSLGPQMSPARPGLGSH